MLTTRPAALPLKFLGAIPFASGTNAASAKAMNGLRLQHFAPSAFTTLPLRFKINIPEKQTVVR